VDDGLGTTMAISGARASLQAVVASALAAATTMGFRRDA
jgi:hypothetical protein